MIIEKIKIMHNKLSIIFFPLLLIWVLPYKLLLAENLYVGVASNFIVPMKIIKNEFEKKNNSQVFISSGSSGSLYAQIMNGAPLDIFLSELAPSTNLIAALAVVNVGSVPVIRNASAV